MACSIEEIDFDPADYDRALGELLLGHKGNSQEFLVSVLAFLKRRTNFFKEGQDAKRKLLEAYRAVSGEGAAGFKGGFFGASKPGASAAAGRPKAAPAQVAATSPVPAAEQPAAAAAAPTPAAAAADAPAAAGPSPSGAAAAAPAAAAIAAAAAAGGAAAASEPAAATAGGEAGPSSCAAAAPGDAVPSDAAEGGADKSDQEGKEGDKGLKPNAGRGADLGSYSWSQTLHEVTVLVPVGPGLRARDLDVDVAKGRLRVGVKGRPPILDGELSEPIKAEETLWNLADGAVELTLTKGEGMHWWRCVLAGGPVIDVTAVEPESSKLDDLDAETRQTVEKMMFDQRQKAMGLPTSDEMQKQEMLKRFMAAHPEMDFSNAKIM